MGFMIGGQVGDMFGWRWALRVTPALLVLLTTFAVPFVQDPARGASDGGVTAIAGEAASGLGGWWRDVTAVLKTPSMLAAIGGQAGCNFAIGAITVWIPTAVTMIEGGQSVVEARGGISPTLVFGGVTVVSGLTGTVLGSIISNKLGPVLSNWGAETLVCAVAMLLAAPLILAALWMIPEPYTGLSSIMPFWVLVLLGEISLCLYWAPIAAFCMLVVTPRRRATAQGLSLLASHLLGDAASPVIIGQVVDMVLASHKCDATTTPNASPNSTFLADDSTPYMIGAPNGTAPGGILGPCDHNGTLVDGKAPVCEWDNVTIGESSGCVDSNSAKVQAYQLGLYLTLPALLVAGALFLCAARAQPADHKAMVAAINRASPGTADGVTDPMLMAEESILHSGVTPRSDGGFTVPGSGLSLNTEPR